MGKWSVGQWIVVVISFQKMYGLNHHIVEKSGDVTDAGQTNKQQAKIGLLSILICEKLSLAICSFCHNSNLTTGGGINGGSNSSSFSSIKYFFSFPDHLAINSFSSSSSFSSSASRLS